MSQTGTQTAVATLPKPDLTLTPERTPEQAGELAPMQVQTVNTIVPARPSSVDDARNTELQETAQQMIDGILKDPGDVRLSMEVMAIGADVMTSNTEHIGLMDTKIGLLLQEIKEGNKTTRTLTEIKSELDKVNPAVLANIEITEPRSWLFGLVTWTAHVIPSGEKVLEIVQTRRESVASVIDGLKRHLWDGRDEALHNATELGQVADKLAATRQDLQESAYVGQIVWQGISEARTEEADPVRQQQLTSLVNDLALQVVDIQTVDNLNVQAQLQCEVLIGNCGKIVKGVHRVTNILLPAVATNLGVKAAAAQQLSLVQSLDDIKSAAEQAIVDTAKTTRQAVTRMEQIQTEGIIDVQALQTAMAEIDEMVSDVEKLRADAEQKAVTVSTSLSQIGERTNRFASAMTSLRQAKAANADDQDETAKIED